MAATLEAIQNFYQHNGEHPRWAILLVNWQYDSTTGMLTGFTTALWELIKTADSDNMERIERGFPDYVEAYRKWAYSNEGADYLKAWGLY